MQDFPLKLGTRTFHFLWIRQYTQRSKNVDTHTTTNLQRQLTQELGGERKFLPKSIAAKFLNFGECMARL